MLYNLLSTHNSFLIIKYMIVVMDDETIRIIFKRKRISKHKKNGEDKLLLCNTKRQTRETENTQFNKAFANNLLRQKLVNVSCAR